MATPELPGVCPSCGKENPPASPVCHFCGASATSRIRLSAMGLGIALLLVITAVHFYQAATYRPDYAPLAALTAERNFERVRVKGRITDIRVIRQQYDHHQVRIEIQGEDAGDHISVRLEGEPANDFLANPSWLNRGDVIDVAASLYAGEGYRHLSVSSMQFIKLLEKGTDRGIPAAAAPAELRYATRPPPPRTTVAELLANSEKFRDQVVIARPLEVTETPQGAPFFRAADKGRPQPDLVIIGFKGTQPKVGDPISVRGKFTYYAKKGYWEIQVRNEDQSGVMVLADQPGE